MRTKTKTAHKGNECVNISTNFKNQETMKKLKEEGIKDIREIRPDFEYPIFVYPRPEAEAEASEQTVDASENDTKEAENTLSDGAVQNEQVAEPTDNASAK